MQKDMAHAVRSIAKQQPKKHRTQQMAFSLWEMRARENKTLEKKPKILPKICVFTIAVLKWTALHKRKEKETKC